VVILSEYKRQEMRHVATLRMKFMPCRDPKKSKVIEKRFMYPPSSSVLVAVQDNRRMPSQKPVEKEIEKLVINHNAGRGGGQAGRSP
jgi:hypothetical protein